MCFPDIAVCDTPVRSQRKTRTHLDESQLTSKVKVPRSMIVRHGKVAMSVNELVQDLRAMMMPNTAVRLKESRKMAVSDFAKFGVPMGVTHLGLFTQTENGVNMRVACLPRGPTLSFRVMEYSMTAEVRRVQRRPINMEVRGASC